MKDFIKIHFSLFAEKDSMNLDITEVLDMRLGEDDGERPMFALLRSQLKRSYVVSTNSNVKIPDSSHQTRAYARAQRQKLLQSDHLFQTVKYRKLCTYTTTSIART